jgi:hypothetical protein
MTLLVDRKFSLTIELKDDTKETSYEAIGWQHILIASQ